MVMEISVALSEEIRLRALVLLSDCFFCVKCLAIALDSPQPTVSRHLSVLRKAGVVKRERKGMRVYYSLDFQGEFGALNRKLIRAYHGVLVNKEPYKSDQKRFKAHALRCDANCCVALRRKVRHGGGGQGQA